MIDRLNKGIMVFTVFAVPLMVIPGLENIFETPKTALILLSACLLFILWVIGREEVRLSSIFMVSCAIAAFSIFSFLYTKNPYFTKMYVTLNLSCLFFMFAVIRYPELWPWAFGAIAVSGSIVSFDTILQFFGLYPVIKWPAGSLASTIGNPNYIGSFLLFPFFALLGLAFAFRKALLPLALLPVLALVFSRARSGWLAFGVSSLVFAVGIIRMKGWRIRRVHVLAAILLLVSVGAVPYLAGDRLSPTLRIDSILNGDTFRYRKKYFRAAEEIIKDSPVIGHGIGSYRNLVYDAQAKIQKRDMQYFVDYPDPKPRRVHNDYLETLVDGGIVYFVLLGIFFTIVLVHGFLIIRRRLPLREHVIVLSALCAVIGSLVSSLFFFQFRLNSNLFLALVMVGVIEGVYQSSRYPGDKRCLIPTKGVTFVALSLILCAILFWYRGVSPLLAERAHYQYRVYAAKVDPVGAEKYLLKSLQYDPDSTMFNMSACQFYRMIRSDPVKARGYLETATVKFNGDLTLWAVYWIRGLLDLQEANLISARAQLYRSLSYFPFYAEAFHKFKEVDQIIKENDSILVRLK